MSELIRHSCWKATSALLFVAALSSTAIASETLFKGHCAKCHPRATSLVQGWSGQADERATALNRFLEAHHAEDPKVRAAIVNYLIELSAQRKTGAG